MKLASRTELGTIASDVGRRQRVKGTVTEGRASSVGSLVPYEGSDVVVRLNKTGSKNDAVSFSYSAKVIDRRKTILRENRGPKPVDTSNID
jgi:hypothetical protein